jgi:Holliday junction resolvase
MPDKPKISEKEITQAIRQTLKLLGVWHYKQAQGLGCVPGIPDIIGIWQGRYLGIEVKTDRGVVSDKQQKKIDEINAQGGIAFVARSVNDVIEKLGIKDRFLV